MNLTESERTVRLKAELTDFLEREVYPAEAVYHRQRAEAADPHSVPPVLEELKASARERGLWNLFLADPELGGGLSVLEYAPLAELMGRSLELAPEATNCSAPDTGNMELLAHFGTAAQRERWLVPLLAGRIRSAFAMTEPAVASSDATNVATRIATDGGDYVVSGRKWFATGALDPRCELLILLGVTNPDAARHERHSMVLIPRETRGVTVLRNMTVFGYEQRQGHGEVDFDEVRIPKANVLGAEGGGFAIAQARLGPGRIHHCMRSIGLAERALELMVQRALTREALGGPLADQGVIREWIARSRVELEQVRLLCLKAAWMMDTVGNKAARMEIAAIKVAAAQVTSAVVDRAIQTFGAAGLSQDTLLGAAYAYAREIRLADGPDEVHLRAIARWELRRGRERLEAAAA
jgi:acyl-CoA dehydrogenase